MPQYTGSHDHIIVYHDKTWGVVLSSLSVCLAEIRDDPREKNAISPNSSILCSSIYLVSRKKVPREGVIDNSFKSWPIYTSYVNYFRVHNTLVDVYTLMSIHISGQFFCITLFENYI